MKKWKMFKLENCSFRSTVRDKKVRGIYLIENPTVKRYIYSDVYNFLRRKSHGGDSNIAQKLSDVFKVKTDDIEWVGRNIPAKEVNTIPPEDVYKTIDFLKNSRVKMEGFSERVCLLKSEIKKYNNETFDVKTHPDFEADKIYETNKKVKIQNWQAPADNPFKNLDENLIKSTIEYLNEKIGSNYKPSSHKTKKHIQARLNEGYDLSNFLKVIDIKSEEWLGTDMAKYLRPETLFGPKFESYLNAPIIENKEIIEKAPWGEDEEGISVVPYKEYNERMSRMRAAYKSLKDRITELEKSFEDLYEKEEEGYQAHEEYIEKLEADKELKDKQIESLTKMVYKLKEEVETMKNEKKIVKDNMAKKIADFFTTN